MISARLLRSVREQYLRVPALRYFHHEFTQPDQPGKEKQKLTKDDSKPPENPFKTDGYQLPASQRHKYKIFREEEATEILDVEEERQRFQARGQPEWQQQDEEEDEYWDLNLKRGLHGVYDIEDLVDVLRKESAEDIFVCSVPKELKYVDYMVVCSGRSYRHMLALAEFVRRVYKLKRTKGDILPKIEGEKSRDWMALDLGNIALHIFSPTAREEYDLESLWAIGSQYDKEFNKPADPLIDLFERHNGLLGNANMPAQPPGV